MPLDVGTPEAWRTWLLRSVADLSAADLLDGSASLGAGPCFIVEPLHCDATSSPRGGRGPRKKRTGGGVDGRAEALRDLFVSVLVCYSLMLHAGCYTVYDADGGEVDVGKLLVPDPSRLFDWVRQLRRGAMCPTPDTMDVLRREIARLGAVRLEAGEWAEDGDIAQCVLRYRTRFMLPC